MSSRWLSSCAWRRSASCRAVAASCAESAATASGSSAAAKASSCLCCMTCVAAIRGVQDTSRQGRYHNARFHDIAHELGITVENDPRIGWSITSVPDLTARDYAGVVEQLAARGAAQLADQHDDETTIVINTFNYAGIGWHTTGDALLANSSAALARQRRHAAKDALAELA
jgi:hypothetical protein